MKIFSVFLNVFIFYVLCNFILINHFYTKILNNTISNKNFLAVIDVFLLLLKLVSRVLYLERKKREEKGNSDCGNSHKPLYRWRKINKNGEGAILFGVFPTPGSDRRKKS